jgi:hypothetical protein
MADRLTEVLAERDAFEVRCNALEADNKALRGERDAALADAERHARDVRNALDDYHDEKRAREWLAGLIEKLPTLDLKWPANIQALWWKHFEALKARADSQQYPKDSSK